MNGSSNLVDSISTTLNKLSWSTEQGKMPVTSFPWDDIDLEMGSIVQVVIAPPFPYLKEARGAFKDCVEIASQNVSEKASGAFTGEVRWVFE